MELMRYAGSELMTGDAIAKAVLNYAKALANSDSSDEVEIPVRHDDGSLGAAQLLIGPASQLIAETITTELEDVLDNELVHRLHHNAARLADPRPVMDDAPPFSDPDFEMADMIDAANGEGRKPHS